MLCQVIRQIYRFSVGQRQVVTFSNQLFRGLDRALQADISSAHRRAIELEQAADLADVHGTPQPLDGQDARGRLEPEVGFGSRRILSPDVAALLRPGTQVVFVEISRQIDTAQKKLGGRPGSRFGQQGQTGGLFEEDGLLRPG